MFGDAAHARARESHALRDAGLMCGAVYLAGYVVECKLKELLTRKGVSFPRSGQAGHDLKGLWDAAGLLPNDLTGHRLAFLEMWSTSIRYTAELPTGCGGPELLDGARDLAAMVTTRIRYARCRKR